MKPLLQTHLELTQLPSLLHSAGVWQACATTTVAIVRRKGRDSIGGVAPDEVAVEKTKYAQDDFRNERPARIATPSVAGCYGACE